MTPPLFLPMRILQEKQATAALLGSMYLCKPTRDVLENWRQLASEPGPPLLDELLATLRQIDPASEKEIDELVWEYTRLFIGPYKLPAPPWESVYTSPKRLMRQEAHDSVQECYHGAGFEVDQEGLMADHIGLELTFLSMLYGRFLESPDQHDFLSSIVESFIRDHLLNWIPQFTEDLGASAELPLYVALVTATKKFVASLK